jgi:hypothetical protein
MEVVLSADEQIVNKQSFTTSFILFWHKTNYTLTNKRIVGENPNTLMGFFPLGQNQVTFPLKSVGGVSGSTKFYTARFLLGLVVAYIGIKMFGSNFLGGLIVLVLGVAALLNSYVATLIISSNTGQSTTVDLSILEKDKVAEMVTATNLKIAELA